VNVRLDSLIALLLAAAVGAAETPTVEPPMPTLRLSAGESTFQAPGGELARSGLLSQGVTADYGGIRIAADRADAAEAVLPDAKQPVLDTLVLSPGPKGPAPEIVTLDSQGSELPRVGFRGLLTPRLVKATRQPPESAQPALVSYVVELKTLDAFSGRLCRDGRWVRDEGWADHAEVLVSARLGDAGLSGWSVDAIVLHGSETPPRKAELHRPAAPAEPPWPALAAGTGRAQTVRLDFRDGALVDGRFSGGFEAEGAMDLLPVKPPH
jgi:hypothetical protein